MVVTISLLTLITMWLTGSWTRCPASIRERIGVHVASPGKDPNARFKVCFLLNAYHFHTITKSKSHKSNHNKSRIICIYLLMLLWPTNFSIHWLTGKITAKLIFWFQHPSYILTFSKQSSIEKILIQFLNDRVNPPLYIGVYPIYQPHRPLSICESIQQLKGTPSPPLPKSNQEAPSTPVSHLSFDTVVVEQELSN